MNYRVSSLQNWIGYLTHVHCTLLCILIYIHIYIYIYIYIHIYIYTNKYISYEYTYHIYVYFYVYTYVYIYIYVYLCILSTHATLKRPIFMGERGALAPKLITTAVLQSRATKGLSRARPQERQSTRPVFKELTQP